MEGGSGTNSNPSQGEGPPVVNPQRFGQLKFTTLDGRGQAEAGAAGGAAVAGAASATGGVGSAAGGLGAMAEIDFDFNILANYLAEEVQYSKLRRC